MYDLTNADRANLALNALEQFSASTGVDTARDAVSDLICNLMHLARICELDGPHIASQAIRMAEEEASEDADGDISAVGIRLFRIFPKGS